MSQATSVSEALLAWAQGYDASIRMNAYLERAGDTTLVTGIGTELARYIDGSSERRVPLSLCLMAPWSEGVDGVNADALATGEGWLAWVEAQWGQGNVPDLPEGMACTAIEADYTMPVLAEVYPDTATGLYRFNANIDYLRRP